MGSSAAAVAGVAAVLGLVAMPAAAQQAALPLQGFSIVLVQGDMAAGDARSNLPEAAARAVDDMKGFLPFRSYHLVDAAWVLADSASGLINAKLKGPDNVEYDVVLEALPASGGGQRVAFRLRETTPNEPSQQLRAMERDLETLKTIAASLREKYDASMRRQSAEKGDRESTTAFLRTQLVEAERRVADLRQRIGPAPDAGSRIESRAEGLHRQIDEERIRVRQLEQELASMREKYKPDHSDVLARRQQLLETRSRLEILLREEHGLTRPFVTKSSVPAGATLIETMFTMRLGETVVVGTSRTGVDKALVAVLTAVPQSKGRGGF